MKLIVVVDAQVKVPTKQNQEECWQKFVDLPIVAGQEMEFRDLDGKPYVKLTVLRVEVSA